MAKYSRRRLIAAGLVYGSVLAIGLVFYFTLSTHASKTSAPEAAPAAKASPKVYADDDPRRPLTNADRVAVEMESRYYVVLNSPVSTKAEQCAALGLVVQAYLQAHDKFNYEDQQARYRDKCGP